MADPEDRSLQYKQELERLKTQQEEIQERIEELELLQDDPNEEAYHPVSVCNLIRCVGVNMPVKRGEGPLASSVG